MRAILIPVTITVEVNVEYDGTIRYAPSVGGDAVVAAVKKQYTVEVLAESYAIHATTRASVMGLEDRTSHGLVRVAIGTKKNKVVSYLCYVGPVDTTNPLITLKGCGNERLFRRSSGREVGGDGARCNLDDVRTIESDRRTPYQ